MHHTHTHTHILTHAYTYNTNVEQIVSCLSTQARHKMEYQLKSVSMENDTKELLLQYIRFYLYFAHNDLTP